MKAMIFAAGLGTRLYPITKDKPKALAKINGKTLLEITIEKLKKNGISDFVINVHHFADKIEEYLKKNNNFGVNIIISDERNKLLDTGGGLLHASKFLSDSNFILHNVDIINNLDINQITFSNNDKCLAKLVCSRRPTSRVIIADKNSILCGWKNKKTGEQIIARKGGVTEVAFNGIHLINPRIFNYFGKKKAFPIIPEYLRIAKNHKIKIHISDAEFTDAGTPESIEHLAKSMNMK